jgi:hypothetical protein
VSPLKARKKPAPVLVADSDSELTGTEDSGLQVEAKKKRDTGKRAFKLREMVQEKRTAMTATANNKRVRLSISISDD